MAQQGDETILEEAKNLLVQGKRFMALDDYQSATDCLEQSCQLFDAFYGVAKRECADAYFEYGLALVALANLEAGSGTDKIMKKAGIEGDEEEEEEEDEEQEDEGEEEDDEEDGGNKEGEEDEEKNEADAKMEADSGGDERSNKVATNGTANSTNGQQVPTGSSSAQVNGVSDRTQDKDKESEPKPSSSSGPEPVAGTSSGNAESKEDEDAENEEATTIEIAWEVLCLAKRLFMTDESLEGRLKLAETLQKIGEISIEWDNNDNAVSILEECLMIRTAILRPDDRLIALTYYNLGLAYSFKSDTQNANENFQKAINVIEKRIASLSEDLEKAKAGQDTVAIGAYQKEINELKELLPDMTMRLDDSKEDSIKSTEAIKRTREEMQQEDDEAKKLCSDKSKPVDDISHLVKRKAT